MISVGSPGSAGSVITDGSCGNGYASLDRVLDRVVGVVGAVDVSESSVDAVGASVGVVCALDGGADTGRDTGVVGAGAGTGAAACGDAQAADITSRTAAIFIRQSFVVAHAASIVLT